MNNKQVVLKKSPMDKVLSFGASYVMVNIGIKACSFVSFPLLTRILPLDRYGILSLLNVILLILIAVAKCGLPNAIIKYLPSHQSKKGKLLTVVFYLTIGASLFSGCLLYVCWRFVPSLDFFNTTLFLLVCGLFFFRTFFSLFIALLRAQEKIRIVNLFTFITQAGSTLFGIFILFLIVWTTTQQAEVQYLLAGNLFWEVSVAVVVFFLIMRKKKVLVTRSYDSVLARSIFFYSLPLLCSELANITLNFADRYLILFFLGTSAVALYSVPYNLAMYLGQGLVIPLGQAIFPIYTRLYEEHGEDATIKFLSMLLKYYVMTSIIILSVSFCIGGDLLVLLASNKYKEAAVLFPWIVLGVLINGLALFLSAGSYLVHKTKIIAWATVTGALFNAALNAVFIPAWGLEGAAYATVLSYCLVVSLIGYFSYRYLPVYLDLKHSVFCVVIALSLYLCFARFCDGNGLVTGIFGALVMVFVYGLLMLFDPQIKEYCFKFVKQFKMKFSG